MARIDQLRSLLAADPSNRFVQYALAQEHAKTGDDDGAVLIYGEILSSDPDYQAAYYHLGKALERLSKPKEARAAYERGIRASFRTNDEHARSELQAALDEIQR